MERIDGLDDRSLILDGEHLEALRWGAVQGRFPVMDLSPGEIKPEGKKKLRIRFGGIATVIWVEPSQKEEAEAFVAAVDSAREKSGS
jgi:hypothetical protein